MNKPIIKPLALLIAAGLLIAGAGCRHKSITRISTSTPDRKMLAELEVRASYKAEGNDAVISFGAHKLVVMKEWLILDDGKGEFGIPENARKIEIQFKHGILTMSAAGNNLIKTLI